MGKIPLDSWLAKTGDQRGQTGRPLVTLSWAQSIDGSLTTRRGKTLALSGPKSLRLTHRLRAAHDAIAVGIGTVLADDPQLTVRLVTGSDPQPIVLDSHLTFPQQAQLIRAERHPWIATVTPADPDKKAFLEAHGACIFECPADSRQQVDLPYFLEVLASKGIRSLMVEGGAKLITSFLEGGLADRVVITISPILVGGLAVVVEQLLPMPRIHDVNYDQVGNDLIVWGVPTW
jgi:riboflavin-specific deaminase-like protein